METRYFFPINSISLADYFGCACIKPSKYFGNKPADIQNKFDSYLLLSDKKIKGSGIDCVLELVLSKDEIKELNNVYNGFYLYKKPLPISRVKTIHFIDEIQRKQTIANIELSTAFIPHELIKESDFDDIDLSILEGITTTPDNNNDWRNNIKRFDSFLGGFALMRLAGEDYMNFSENYFSTLSFFNKVIQKELQQNNINITDKYFDAFVGEKGFKKLFPIINKRIEEEDLNILAKEDGQTILKNSVRLIDLSKLDKDTKTYIAAVLYTYKVGQEAGMKKIDELIRTNFKEVAKGEGIALCYGLNRGYSAFNNKYKDKIVKFQLNSQLDYYTIESLYQYAFNQIKSEEFPYLSWCPKQKLSKIMTPDYRILDVVVKGKKKARLLSSEYLENLLLQFFQKDNASLFRGLFEKMREIIYKDAKNEIAEDYENQIIQKQEEIENLKAELKKLLEIQKTTSTKGYEQREELSAQTIIVEDPQMFYTSEKYVKKAIEKYLAYKEKGKKVLENEAKAKGINVKSKKIDEIILLLMTTPDSNIPNL